MNEKANNLKIADFALYCLLVADFLAIGRIKRKTKNKKKYRVMYTLLITCSYLKIKLNQHNMWLYCLQHHTFYYYISKSSYFEHMEYA